jgi:hypothetical protein
VKIENRHLHAINNSNIYINKRINKLKLHNFIVKNRMTNNKNVIHIKNGQYSYKLPPERILRG